MTARYIVADVYEGLATLPDNSVDLIVTSPPFLALRSYLPADHPDKAKEIGRESTPAEFVDRLLDVTDHLARVLAPHGSLCLELGDTYAGSGGAGGDYDHGGWRDGQPTYNQPWNRDGWPMAKCMALVPEIYRLALAYGFNPLTGVPSPAGRWLIRNVITWARPNPPVGALADKWRPATSDLVIATRSPRRYWDDLATRRPIVDGDPDAIYWEPDLFGETDPRPMGSKPRRERKLGIHWRTDGDSREGNNSFDKMQYSTGHPAGAPLLDYWEIPPGGYTGAHYAVFPPELVEPCINAMCPRRVCQTCGEPSRRLVESRRYDQNGETVYGDWNANNRGPDGYVGSQGAKTTQSGTAVGTEFVDLGWSDCGHDDWRPGLVLDPFAGSGTTLLVATGHGRDAIGIDLDARNLDQAVDRVGGLLLETA